MFSRSPSNTRRTPGSKAPFASPGHKTRGTNGVLYSNAAGASTGPKKSFSFLHWVAKLLGRKKAPPSGQFNWVQASATRTPNNTVDARNGVAQLAKTARPSAAELRQEKPPQPYDIDLAFEEFGLPSLRGDGGQWTSCAPKLSPQESALVQKAQSPSPLSKDDLVGLYGLMSEDKYFAPDLPHAGLLVTKFHLSKEPGNTRPLDVQEQAAEEFVHFIKTGQKSGYLATQPLTAKRDSLFDLDQYATPFDAWDRLVRTNFLSHLEPGEIDAVIDLYVKWAPQ